MRDFAQHQVGHPGDDHPDVFDRIYERNDRGTISRREALAGGAALGAALLLGASVRNTAAEALGSDQAPFPTSKLTPHSARVAIVGAGLAGVAAAYQLTKVGVHVELFEARDRVGGRCWTAREFDQGQSAEHGGEFIDTRHVHLRDLAHDLGLHFDDLWKGWVSGSTWPNWVGGQLMSHADIKAQLNPIIHAVISEAHRIGVFDSGHPTTAAYTFGTATARARALDRRSMAEWLDAKVPGVIGTPFADYLDEIMGSWYGLEMDQLSAVNWIDYFVIPWPGGDERWRVRGGNDLVPNKAARKLPAHALKLETALTSITRSNGLYRLRFDGGHSAEADLLILALPFTTLRQVDLNGSGLSQQKLRAIEQQGMGADVKLLLQYDQRPQTFNNWSGGMEHTDPNFETWESSTDEHGDHGLITVYAGGRTGAGWTARMPHGRPPQAFTQQTLAQIDEVVPGSAAHFNGNAWIDLWTQDRWTRGAYAAFTPGQMTKFWGYNGSADGNIHFAGEHTSTYSQGFLNGGVESGYRAAIEVMRKLGITPPASIANLPYSVVTS
jgi:monoamine oxidase